MDFPGNAPTPLLINTFSAYSGVYDMTRLGATIQCASITWPVANTGFYVPMMIPFPYLVKRVFWVNGSSVTTTNMDFGIYTFSGTKIYSTGSTAQSGISVPQYVTPGTDILLTPGRYYFGLSCTSVTANRGGQGSTGAGLVKVRQVGILQEASVATLPATMTGVAVANSCVPLCGVTRTTTGFA